MQQPISKTAVLTLILSLILSFSNLAGSHALNTTEEFEQEAPGNKYTLGIGDKIEIVVWRNDDLNKTVTIRPDGNISLPLIGEINAYQLTPAELSGVITAKLGLFIKSPKVSVIVTNFGSRRILVLGEVKKPGIYTLSKQLTALEAIGMADGYTDDALLKNTLIVKKPYSANPIILSADLHRVIKNGEFGNDIILEPGDIVYVPTSFLGKIKDFVGFFNANIKPVADSYLLYRAIDD
ncbi:MAG: polysaccharide biosynthesis/export family protein [Candidatus Omnitrophota bacterium]